MHKISHKTRIVVNEHGLNIRNANMQHEQAGHVIITYIIVTEKDVLVTDLWAAETDVHEIVGFVSTSVKRKLRTITVLNSEYL